MNMLSNMRRRVTLLSEATHIGAGGRQQKTHPLIADVWAKVEEDGNQLETRADGEIFPAKAKFTVRYSYRFAKAKAIEWRQQHYRVTGMVIDRSFEPMINFTAVTKMGEQV
ncbi:phage head closure protein [Kordiimonas laminariae]|uniref:phage head closure protein n=1 Tax=Kordiimonas laminariae TaxID=2917717 RepID=UPI001FF4150F|nr:phage head closure protein [Kordiimonas laminariae]MCK0068040.1 phage head closure protein [Kordiimonas laminariae]